MKSFHEDYLMENIVSKFLNQKNVKNIIKKISVSLSFYYFSNKSIIKKKHSKISGYLKKKINIYFKKNPRLNTHIKLSNEI